MLYLYDMGFQDFEENRIGISQDGGIEAYIDRKLNQKGLK
jgi:hypothetical protein